MKKRTWIISLLVIILVVISGLVISLRLAIAHLREQPPLWYYVQFTTSTQELPTRLIGPALRYVAGRELPEKTGGLRAIFQGGRDPRIFVRFDTDTEGIAYVKRSFTGPGASSKHLDADTLKRLTLSGYRMFYLASQWQDENGVCLFDQESIESGLEINSAAGPGAPQRRYHVFIDDQNSTVYINAVWR